MSTEPTMELLRDWPQGEPVPAISIKQPWAAAVTWLGKDIENRSRWLFKHRGPVLIHASNAKFYAEDVEAMLKVAREDGVPADVLENFTPTGYKEGLYAQGAIVAVARLADVIGKDDDVSEENPAAGSPWAHDEAEYWLHLTDVEPCNPHAYKGQVGLFRVPYDVASSLTPFFSETSDSAPQAQEQNAATPARKKGPARKESPLVYMRPLRPDPVLAAIVGSEPLVRTELTTRIWNYIVEHNLQDASNKRMINCDAKLCALTGKDQVDLSELTKFVLEHLS